MSEESPTGGRHDDRPVSAQVAEYVAGISTATRKGGSSITAERGSRHRRHRGSVSFAWTYDGQMPGPVRGSGNRLCRNGKDEIFTLSDRKRVARRLDRDDRSGDSRLSVRREGKAIPYSFTGSR